MIMTFYIVLSFLFLPFGTAVIALAGQLFLRLISSKLLSAHTNTRQWWDKTLWSGQFFYSGKEVSKQETKTTRGWTSEDDPRLWIFCSLCPRRHKIVNCVLGVGLHSVSCTGAAVSCLKLAVDFWTQQTFINRGRWCSTIYPAWQFGGGVELKESLSENKIQSWSLMVGQSCRHRWFRPPWVRVCLSFLPPKRKVFSATVCHVWMLCLSSMKYPT